MLVWEFKSWEGPCLLTGFKLVCSNSTYIYTWSFGLSSISVKVCLNKTSSICLQFWLYDITVGSKSPKGWKCFHYNYPTSKNLGEKSQNPRTIYINDEHALKLHWIQQMMLDQNHWSVIWTCVSMEGITLKENLSFCIKELVDNVHFVSLFLNSKTFH